MTSAHNSGTVPTIEVKHRLRIAREYAGLDQDQLAVRMDVTRSTISNAEQGKVKPRRMTVNAWAMACGVPASWINTGEQPDQPDPDGGGSAADPDDPDGMMGTIYNQPTDWDRTGRSRLAA